MNKRYIIFISIFLILAIFGSILFQQPAFLWRWFNNRGVAEINSQLSVKQKMFRDFSASRDWFVRSIQENPNAIIPHLNLGLAFEWSEQDEPSQKSYKKSLLLSEEQIRLFLNKENSSSKKDKEEWERHFVTRMLSHYNIARFYGRKKNIDKALEHYQKALEGLDEKSKEAQRIQVNIEWLFKSQQNSSGSSSSKDPQDGTGQNSQSKNQKGGQKPQKKKSFKSDKLTGKDVSQIMEELKRQEQKIREKEYRKGVKERSNEKDW